MKLDAAQREEARQIARELAQIARSGDVLAGTITQRLTLCGKPNCACHGDPPRRHGPYWHWTRKVQGKTTGSYLSKEQAREYQRWIDNDRRIHELVSRLEAIGIQRLQASQQRE
ncbi:MAG TPA: DUF6788 family protein [Solirubrobacteraceae bacterium]|nr:DUF6788 family protein [Solirubrobacteraceae bacterium]